MGISRWDPSKDLSLMQERLNRLFSDPNDTSPEMAEGARYLPPVDIVETSDDVVLRVELPGVDKADIDIQIENEILILKGERRFEKEVDQEHYYRMEFSYGSFERSFTLPCAVDASDVKAVLRDGILTVELPRCGSEGKKTIDISTR